MTRNKKKSERDDKNWKDQREKWQDIKISERGDKISKDQREREMTRFQKIIERWLDAKREERERKRWPDITRSERYNTISRNKREISKVQREGEREWC